MPEHVRVNELSKQMVAIIKFIGYLPSTGVKKDMVLKSVAGKAWTDLQRIPKPVTDGFDALVSKYHMVVNKNGRYFLTHDGQTVFDHYNKKAEAAVNVETIAAVTGGTIVDAAGTDLDERVKYYLLALNEAVVDFLHDVNKYNMPKGRFGSYSLLEDACDKFQTRVHIATVGLALTEDEARLHAPRLVGILHELYRNYVALIAACKQYVRKGYLKALTNEASIIRTAEEIARKNGVQTVESLTLISACCYRVAYEIEAYFK